MTWDSPIPSAEGEDVFVAQVDFAETGKVMADMALSILGADGGKFAILSASPDAANQNAWIAAMKEALKDPKYAKLELLDTVYGNDQSEESYNQANALVDKYPDMKLIMAPTSVGIVAAAKALQDEGLCDKVKVSGLGVPSEMLAYTHERLRAGVRALELRRSRLPDLLHRLSAGDRRDQGRRRRKFTAGRMGEYTITKDPTRDGGPAHPDGPVLGLQQGQRRGGCQAIVFSEKSAGVHRARRSISFQHAETVAMKSFPLRSDLVSLAITRNRRAVVRCSFTLEDGRRVSPMHLRPWAGEQLPARHAAHHIASCAAISFALRSARATCSPRCPSFHGLPASGPGGLRALQTVRSSACGRKGHGRHCYQACRIRAGEASSTSVTHGGGSGRFPSGITPCCGRHELQLAFSPMDEGV